MTQKDFDALVQVAVLVADGEVDSVVNWSADAVAHVKDLRAMGCEVKVRLFADWRVAERFEDACRGGL